MFMPCQPGLSKNLELDSTGRNHAYSIGLNGGIVIDLQSHGSGYLDWGHEGAVGPSLGVCDVLLHHLPTKTQLLMSNMRKRETDWIDGY